MSTGKPDLPPPERPCDAWGFHPPSLRCVFESGIDYAVRLLAKELGVDDWSVCDGTEEFDGDLGGTMINIVIAALPADPQGDPIYPSEIKTTISQLRAALSQEDV